MKPTIGITMGDPAGIGPEIIVKTLADGEVYAGCNPLVVGDAGVMRRAVALLKLPVELRAVRQLSEAEFAPGIIAVLDLHNVAGELEWGRVSAAAGHAAFEAVRTVIELALRGELQATVTAPINKEAINLAGHHFSGHTEIYAQLTNTKKYAMLLAGDKLRVVHVSTHVSLREACDAVKADRIVEVIQLLDDACRQFGIAQPNIAVAGLNPHASDGGLFGWEEEREIAPAIRRAREMGYRVQGPIPPDSMFSKAIGGQYDGCVAMYHDQGHIPFKVDGFRWNEAKQRLDVRGVNITLGLPIIRVSVDHGTAFEVAGKGVASEEAMRLSIGYATRMAKV
ncbi:MAG: 4-hydroxythreonine-4-phosphate dehydrogenase PdxA [Prevotellaceae bacterium]|jgi:4-hydroxythreonine-4-phosphate dehydrogenase|nr:4-hydroxythreonine-4-phosphate dehydrogenase PdxA [Prevotellaceae bacterium]